jgi:hypothetical protein
VQQGRLLPGVPAWCHQRCSEVPAFCLVVNDWLVLPLQPSTRPAPDVFMAVTCMYRGMRGDQGLRPQQALLCAEKLRLHREALLRLAADPPLHQAA